jgi:predicted amidohydrolase YtcJ
MAPLSPLTLIWAATARETIGGTPGIASEALSRGQALRGVTLDAAWILGMEDDLGSIRAGKIADFTILDEDPMTVPDEELRNIQVLGTVFSGQPYTISK